MTEVFRKTDAHKAEKAHKSISKLSTGSRLERLWTNGRQIQTLPQESSINKGTWKSKVCNCVENTKETWTAPGHLIPVCHGLKLTGPPL